MGDSPPTLAAPVVYSTPSKLAGQLAVPSTGAQHLVTTQEHGTNLRVGE